MCLPNISIFIQSKSRHLASITLLVPETQLTKLKSEQMNAKKPINLIQRATLVKKPQPKRTNELDELFKNFKFSSFEIFS